jgi:hypothetical protein
MDLIQINDGESRLFNLPFTLAKLDCNSRWAISHSRI